jgi:hypothetical protein
MGLKKVENLTDKTIAHARVITSQVWDCRGWLRGPASVGKVR